MLEIVSSYTLALAYDVFFRKARSFFSKYGLQKMFNLVFKGSLIFPIAIVSTQTVWISVKNP